MPEVSVQRIQRRLLGALAGLISHILKDLQNQWHLTSYFDCFTIIILIRQNASCFVLDFLSAC